jgi:bifunctional DNA-binding transcriptional regulator/antitoxin component of YhaV-PrlF toxin-antitoxin module
MLDTQHARKLDSSGRLVIPARLREELGLQVGDLCQFYLHQENGKRYLCIEVENEIERAKRMLEANGYQVSGLTAGVPSPNFE